MTDKEQKPSLEKSVMDAIHSGRVHMRPAGLAARVSGHAALLACGEQRLGDGDWGRGGSWLHGGRLRQQGAGLHGALGLPCAHRLAFVGDGLLLALCMSSRRSRLQHQCGSAIHRRGRVHVSVRDAQQNLVDEAVHIGHGRVVDRVVRDACVGH